MKTGWQNGVFKYDEAGAAATVTNRPHIFEAFAYMYYKTKFDRLPKYEAYSDKTSVPVFIGASIEGVAQYEAALRASQDTFVSTGRQDPAFNGPTYRGIEMVYISDLDTAALYGADGTLLTENAATLGGPRYYCVNGMYMLKVIHSERYFYKKKPFSPSNQPYTHICIVDIWHNNVCRSRRRHAIVTPLATVVP